MPRYFFDTDDGSLLHGDEDGQLVADAEAARRVALGTLAGLARDLLAREGNEHALTVSVRDDAGRVVFTACLSLRAEWFE